MFEQFEVFCCQGAGVVVSMVQAEFGESIHAPIAPFACFHLSCLASAPVGDGLVVQ